VLNSHLLRSKKLHVKFKKFTIFIFKSLQLENVVKYEDMDALVNFKAETFMHLSGKIILTSSYFSFKPEILVLTVI